MVLRWMTHSISDINPRFVSFDLTKLTFQHAIPILKFLLQWFEQSSSEHDGLLIEQLACIVISRYSLLLFVNY